MEAQINPTRMNLLAIKGQLKFVRQGIDLLAKKRDAMLQEFLEILSKVYSSQKNINAHLSKSVAALIISQGIHGDNVYNSTTLASNQNIKLDLKEKNIWGVKVFDFEHNFKLKNTKTRKFDSTIQTSINNCADNFEKIGFSILNLIPVKVKLEKIGTEIKKTNRKINALEQQLMPKLGSQANRIAQTLEERAREETFKLKKLKNKKRRK